MPSDGVEEDVMGALGGKRRGGGLAGQTHGSKVGCLQEEGVLVVGGQADEGVGCSRSAVGEAVLCVSGFEVEQALGEGGRSGWTAFCRGGG